MYFHAVPKSDPKSFIHITFVQNPGPPGEISGLTTRSGVVIVIPDIKGQLRLIHDRVMRLFEPELRAIHDECYEDAVRRRVGH